MKYGNIKNVDKKVSRLIYGCAIGDFFSGGDMSEILDAVVDAGINTLDTARIYQLSEKSVGDWMEKRGNRDDLVILTKCAHPLEDGIKRVNRKEILDDFRVSTGYLKTGYIDIYMMHRDDPDCDLRDVMETLSELHEAGKIGAIGASNWTSDRIEKANETAYKYGLTEITVSSPHLSAVDQVRDPWAGGVVTITGEKNRYQREWYRETKFPLIAYSSLAHGFLSGRVTDEESAKRLLDESAVTGYDCPENYIKLKRIREVAENRGSTVALVSMAWLFHQDMDVYAAVSSLNPARIRENVRALDMELTKEELEYIEG